jgi:zinc protease
MKRLLLTLVAGLVAGGFLCLPQAGAQAPAWKQIPVPPLPAFHPQEPKRVELPNGMIIFLQEDHELPLIDSIARIRGGSRSEPADKTGMLDMYGEVWRTGGTKTQTGDQLDDYLEVRAAKVETNNNADSTSISLSCLKEDFDDVFRVFANLLQNPEFRAEKLELAQKEMADAISRRNDEVSGIAGREAVILAYGKNNPYARQPEYATVDAVSRQDLVDWHKAHLYPNNIILGIVGDFDSTVMEANLQKAFADWPKGPADKAPDIQFDPAKPGYYLIPKSDVNQSSIRMVELGIRRDNPDFYATAVFNEVFGGGFSSRLMQDLRSARGLAYSVGGGIGASFDHPGMVQISMGTKSASTVEAIQGIFDQIDGLAKKPVTDEEIQRAKDSILNSFVFNFDSPEKVLRERMAYEFYGYPPDFLERFRSGIEKVQKADVDRAAAKYLHKDKLAVLVVGNTAEFDKPLSSLGPVTNIDIAIPPPPGEKQEAAPAKPTASNAEGKQLAAKVVEAMGGMAKLQAVKSMRTALNEQNAEGGGPGTSLQVTIVFPDHLRADIQTPNGTLAMVITPQSGFMAAAGMGQRDMPAAQKNEMLLQIQRDPVYIAQHLNDPAFIFFAGGGEKIGDVQTQIVDVSAGAMTIRWFVDPQTGHILREAYQTLGQAGPVVGETDYSDWKTTDGIPLPAMHRNKEGGKDSSVVEFTSVQFNPAVDPKMFDKPAEGKPQQ